MAGGAKGLFFKWWISLSRAARGRLHRPDEELKHGKGEPFSLLIAPETVRLY
jgi:hypothetical protein